jgi:hypothetical protein
MGEEEEFLKRKSEFMAYEERERERVEEPLSVMDRAFFDVRRRETPHLTGEKRVGVWG